MVRGGKRVVGGIVREYSGRWLVVVRGGKRVVGGIVREYCAR